MEKLFKQLERYSVRKRLIFAALLAFFSDLINVYYINVFYINDYVSMDFIQKIMLMNGINPAGLTTTEMLEFQKMIMQTLGTGFFIALVIHVIIYTCVGFNRKFAKQYVYWYTLFAVVVSIFQLWSVFTSSIFWGVVITISTFMYFLSYGFLNTIRNKE
jgi:hypothetical protein